MVIFWNKCCELSRDATLPHLPLTPFISIRLQLLCIFVTAAWEILARRPQSGSNHNSKLARQVLLVRPESSEGRVERLKRREVRDGRRGRASGEKLCQGPLAEFLTGAVLCRHTENHGKTRRTINHEQRGGTSLLETELTKLLMRFWVEEWMF